MLIWTTQRPTKAGGYWYRDDKVTCIREVREDLTVGHGAVHDPLYRNSGEWTARSRCPCDLDDRHADSAGWYWWSHNSHVESDMLKVVILGETFVVHNGEGRTLGSVANSQLW
ncbi:MAG: hypothetical protein ABIU05_01020 [Nitrospirales bacterium]